jgi:tRNA dimethylallyltransferase
LRTGQRRERPFDVLKLAIDLPREEMFDRINRRVDKMVQAGMIEEARRVYPLRHLNSLNTVGFKELFAYFDGTMDLETAIARIGKNTRVYAKKQLTWLKKDTSVRWLTPDEVAEINRGNLSFLIGQCPDAAQSCQ